MKVDSIKTNNMIKDHQREVKNLNHKNEMEINEIKQNHKIRKEKIKIENNSQIEKTRFENEKKKSRELAKQEEKLKAASKTLEETQDVLERKKQALIKDSEEFEKQQKIVNKLNFEKAEFQNKIAIQELNDKTKQDLTTIDRKYKLERANKLGLQRQEGKNAEELHEGTMNLNKDIYNKKRAQTQKKYRDALFKMQKTQKNTLAELERKGHNKAEFLKKNGQQRIIKIDKDSKIKEKQRMVMHSQDYQELINSQEKDLQTLVGRKEKILNRLKDYLWEGYKLGVKKSQDPFYKFGKMDVTLKQREKGYQIEIPVAEHEASNINLTGKDRQIRISMQRGHDWESTNPKDGISNSMHKSESYMTKLPLENMIDPRTIKKSYQDGKLIYQVDYL